MSDLGIVTIGRNEGERLCRCLNSLVGHGLTVVYVDSNSTDGSVELAHSLDVEVVQLDLSQPVCVPRARNEGFERLCQVNPEVRFVQFVDGDCEMVEGWLDRARQVLENRPDVALVTGRRRERFAKPAQNLRVPHRRCRLREEDRHRSRAVGLPPAGQQPGFRDADGILSAGAQ